MDARIQINGVWYLRESLVMSTEVSVSDEVGCQQCGVTGKYVIWTAKRQQFFAPWLKQGNIRRVPLLPGDGWEFLPREVSPKAGDTYWSIPQQKWQCSTNHTTQCQNFTIVGPYRRRAQPEEEPATAAPVEHDCPYPGLERYLGKRWVDRNDFVTDVIELSVDHRTSVYKLQATVRRAADAPLERRTWTAEGRYIDHSNTLHPFDLMREYVPPEVKPVLVREYTHVMWLEPVWSVEQPTGSVSTGRIGYVHVNPPEA